jgi:Ca2+-transporting ATPase
MSKNTKGNRGVFWWIYNLHEHKELKKKIEKCYNSHMEKHEMIKNYWSLDKEQLFEVVQSSEQGLTNQEAENRKKIYGDNVIQDSSKNTVVRILGEQFLSPLIWILIFAGCVTGYLQEIIETVVIFSAVGINILFAFYQEYKAENTIDQLKSYIKNRATVLRDGALHDMDAKDLVPGDIVSITYGNRIPADGRIIDATNLRIDEAILTGESLPIEKGDRIIHRDEIAERKNSVFCGTYVTQGVALFVVTAIGSGTEIGKIVTSVASAKRSKTPVQNAVRQISWYIFSITLVIVGFIFVLGISRGENIFDMLVLSAAVAVGAVPEALPITLTVILSVGVFAISKKGGLIRKLDAAETLGSTTLILTDKTGTLTKSELTLDAVYAGDDLLDNHLEIEQDITMLSKKQLEYIQTTASNIQATVEKTGDDPLKWVYTGAAFDVVILKSMYRFGINPGSHGQGKLTLPFSSSNKYSIATHETSLVILGAPDILIKASSWSDQDKHKALATIVALSEQGKRLIALGKKSKESQDETIEGLTIEAVFAFSDPLREEVIGAIADIQSKGVSVKIITGDMIGTARAIAHRVGISAQDHEILIGEQIKGLDDEALKKLLPTINLFARTTPEDKLRIGSLYQQLGEVVAMTGDGVNDAPALKAMDIGISLGSASDVAKSSADMILLDNNFKID